MVKILTNKIIPKLLVLTQVKDSGWVRLKLLDGWVASDVPHYRTFTVPGGHSFTCQAA